MIIGVDLTQTPDVRQIVKAGIYLFQILKVEDKAPQKAETKGMNVVLDLKIVQPADSPDAGRELTYYCFIPSDSKRADAFTNIKRVFMSAGIPIQNTGMDTRLLPGRTLTAEVTNGVRKDDSTGQMKETYGIGQVFIPADNIQVGASVQGTQMPSAVDAASVLGGQAVVNTMPPQVPQQQPNGGVPGLHPSFGQTPPSIAAPPQMPPIAPQVAPPQQGIPQMPPAFTPPQQ